MAAAAPRTSEQTPPADAGLEALQQQKRVPLLLRGQLREQHLEQSIRRLSGGNGVVVSRGSITGAEIGSARRLGSSRRLSVAKTPAFSMTSRNLLAAGDDQLDDLLQGVSSSASAPGHLPRSDKAVLVLQASLALWLHHGEARGFRRWKESTQQRVDLATLLAAGVNVREEARQLLLAAETKRRVLLTNSERPRLSISPSVPRLSTEAESKPLDREKLLEAKFTRDESDLLLAWARHTQPKTFRGVDDFTMREVLRFLRFRQYQDGDAIFFEGDKGDVFYLVLEGSVGIYGATKRPTQAQQAQQGAQTTTSSRSQTADSAVSRDKPDLNLMGPRMFTYRAGESFGETAMFTKDAIRTASAIACGVTTGLGVGTSGSGVLGTVCEVGELPREVYARTLKRFHQHFFAQAQRVNFAQRVPLFRDWPRARVAAVAEMLELRRLSFGSVLLSQGVSPLAHCFFVLCGTVSLTTQIQADSLDDDCTFGWKKTRHRAQITIELHTVRAGEAVALEALLEGEDSVNRVTYTAVGASADVEVYALSNADGRELLASATPNVLQYVQATCMAERRQREERIEAARRALREREILNRQRRLELEKEALELGLTDEQQRQRQQQLELQELRESEEMDVVADDARHWSSRGLQRPFLPNLDADRLLAGVAENDLPSSSTLANLEAGRDAPGVTVDTSLGIVAAPPKMLSTVVKNFVFPDSDTLADDYAERLTLRLPARSTLSPLLSCKSTSSRASSPPKIMTSISTHTARRRRVPVPTVATDHMDERRRCDLHMKQLSIDYDAKVHWDPDHKRFVLLQPPRPITTDTPIPTLDKQRQQGPGLPSAMMPTTSLGGLKIDTGLKTQRGVQQTELHRQLEATQTSARKLLDEHARQHGQRQSRVAPPSSFVHFF